MNDIFEAPMNMYAAQLNAAKRFVDACVAGTERMDRLFLEATKDMLHAEIDGVKAVAQCRTPQDLMSLAAARPSYERIVARNNEMLRAMTEFGTSAFNVAQGLAEKAQVEANGAMTKGAANDPKAAEPFAQMVDFWQSSSRQFIDSMQAAATFAAPAPVKAPHAQAAGKNRPA